MPETVRESSSKERMDIIFRRLINAVSTNGFQQIKREKPGI
jgi:hypothetical protein